MVPYCRSKVLQNALLEHSAILLTCIKLYTVLKTIFVVFFEWPLKTGFAVQYSGMITLKLAEETVVFQAYFTGVMAVF